MNKIIILLALAAMSCGASAQNKQSGATAPGRHNTVVRRKQIDTANLRILYAWNAEDIKPKSVIRDLFHSIF